MKQVVAALIMRDGKVLICQRTPHQPMALKWEFPGGKIEPGEQPKAALKRELEEELGINANIGDEVAQIRHHRLADGFRRDLVFAEAFKFAHDLRNRLLDAVRIDIALAQ